jgi:hypothetical protein
LKDAVEPTCQKLIVTCRRGKGSARRPAILNMVAADAPLQARIGVAIENGRCNFHITPVVCTSITITPAATRTS